MRANITKRVKIYGMSNIHTGDLLNQLLIHSFILTAQSYEGASAGAGVVAGTCKRTQMRVVYTGVL